MSNRYEPVTTDVEDVLRSVRNQWFPELGDAKILCIFDTKKKQSQGKLVLADIKKPSEFEKFLTMDDTTGDTYDYIMRIDMKAWSLATSNDQTRLIRHELRHTFVDNDAKEPYKTRGHSIEDFYSEIRLNEDNPRWSEELAGKVHSAYEEEKDTD
jgi:hypothetical protein